VLYSPTADTKEMIRNNIDEYAVENFNCQWFPEWAEHFREVCEHYFQLWEGHNAGKPMRLLDWQRECTDHIFGWGIWSKEYNQWIRRFRIATCFVPKKNGKSPLAAAVGNYLLCFDDEPGQQVWSAAKDGKQAQIVHRHAQNMAKASPQMQDMGIKVNGSTGRILFPANNSFYGTMAADNIQSQEGLNGSCILDEIHVVPDKLAVVLDGMGASRRNPLRFEISTAGDNPYGYGGKQYEYGKAVNEGLIKDIHHFFRVWEVPQDTKDEALVNDEKLWELANPALGITVSRDQFKSSMLRARRSVTDWANFKQRRFGIWQKSANPFLKAHDWAACTAKYSFEDFYGQGGGIGLDMARNHDFAAATFVVRFGEGWRIWPIIWATESGIAAVGAQVSRIYDWLAQGQLIQVEGATITNEDIVTTLDPLIELVGTRLMAYDPTFATDIVNSLHKKHRRLIAGEFKQTFQMYAHPTAEFESAVIDHNLQHPDNEVLNWMAGHCLAKEVAGKKKPLKDENAPWQKIDAVQASVMGLHACCQAPQIPTNIRVVAV